MMIPNCSACQSCWIADQASHRSSEVDEELSAALVMTDPAPRRQIVLVILSPTRRLQVLCHRHCHRGRPHSVDCLESRAPAIERHHPCRLDTFAVEWSTMECFGLY